MKIKDNLGAVLVTIAILFILLLIVVLTLFDKPIDGFLGSITTLLTLGAGFGLIGNQLNKVGKNVNGNSTRMMNTIDEQNKRIVELGGTPVPLVDKEKIEADRDSLPAHAAE